MTMVPEVITLPFESTSAPGAVNSILVGQDRKYRKRRINTMAIAARIAIFFGISGLRRNFLIDYAPVVAVHLVSS